MWRTEQHVRGLARYKTEPDTQQRKEVLEEAKDELGKDEVPTIKVVEIILSNQVLNDLLYARSRSYNTYNEDSNRIFVKKHSWNTWVKETQWNSDCVKTTYQWSEWGW